MTYLSASNPSQGKYQPVMKTPKSSTIPPPTQPTNTIPSTGYKQGITSAGEEYMIPTSATFHSGFSQNIAGGTQLKPSSSKITTVLPSGKTIISYKNEKEAPTYEVYVGQEKVATYSGPLGKQAAESYKELYSSLEERKAHLAEQKVNRGISPSADMPLYSASKVGMRGSLAQKIGIAKQTSEQSTGFKRYTEAGKAILYSAAKTPFDIVAEPVKTGVVLAAVSFPLSRPFAIPVVAVGTSASLKFNPEETLGQTAFFGGTIIAGQKGLGLLSQAGSKQRASIKGLVAEDILPQVAEDSRPKTSGIAQKIGISGRIAVDRPFLGTKTYDVVGYSERALIGKKFKGKSELGITEQGKGTSMLIKEDTVGFLKGRKSSEFGTRIVESNFIKGEKEGKIISKPNPFIRESVVQGKRGTINFATISEFKGSFDKSLKFFKKTSEFRVEEAFIGERTTPKPIYQEYGIKVFGQRKVYITSGGRVQRAAWIKKRGGYEGWGKKGELLLSKPRYKSIPYLKGESLSRVSAFAGLLAETEKQISLKENKWTKNFLIAPYPQVGSRKYLPLLETTQRTFSTTTPTFKVVGFQEQKPKEEVIIELKFRQVPGVYQLSGIKEKPFFAQKVISKSPIVSEGYSIEKTVPLPRFPKIGFPLPFGGGGFGGAKGGNKRNVVFNPKYVASIEASVLKIKGPKPSATKLATGIVMRPIER